MRGPTAGTRRCGLRKDISSWHRTRAEVRDLGRSLPMRSAAIGKVFVDLIKGLDYAESLAFVDTTRTAAAGASFGGYMMNWFLGNVGDRFKAIVTHDGVYSFTSAYGTTDEIWFDEWDHGGPPWQNPDEYARFSPHLYARNFRTPTLVIQGALDYRVSESEGMQLFTALQRQGVPSEFLYLPDEGHLVLKPANSQLWRRTVFGWLAQFLKNWVLESVRINVHTHHPVRS